MTKQQVKTALLEAIKQVQTQSQRDIPILHDGSCLVGDVPGCDSLVVVEISIILTEILAPLLDGREIPDSILLGQEKGKRPTLDEIAASVVSFVATKISERVPATKQ